MENLELKESFESLTETSPEVFEFQKLEGFLKKVKNDFNLNEEEVANLDGMLTFQILKKEQRNVLVEKLNTHLLLTKDEIVTKKILENVLSFFTPQPEENTSTENTPQDSTPPQTPPSDVLSSLKERITVPTTIKPITTVTPQKTPEQKSASTIDPYRELPQ